jgi:hypothetical protein
MDAPLVLSRRRKTRSLRARTMRIGRNGGERLRHWQTFAPKSVTPRIAEATFWIRFAWKARGGAFADKVKPEVWPVFEERLADAARVLKDNSAQVPGMVSCHVDGRSRPKLGFEAVRRDF